MSGSTHVKFRRFGHNLLGVFDFIFLINLDSFILIWDHNLDVNVHIGKKGRARKYRKAFIDFDSSHGITNRPMFIALNAAVQLSTVVV